MLEPYSNSLYPIHEPVAEARVYLIEVPVEGGGRLLVQVSDAELPGDLQLASARPGEVAARARQSLEQALDQIKPAVRAVLDRLVAMSPDEVSVEFGLALGAETGVVIAKGTTEMHFAVTLGWKRPRPSSVANDD
ncbi:MAG TPA: CU044_2847 family protein [Pseudonocardiaceae bacterium]|nr:CU044_2847 family protein [Pseudonocardiaceae bacterium]